MPLAREMCFVFGAARQEQAECALWSYHFNFVYHYIFTGNEPAYLFTGIEPAPDGMDNVWSAIRRPSARPTLTAIPGIRSPHVFRVGSNTNVLCVRELSCRCRHCMARD